VRSHRRFAKLTRGVDDLKEMLGIRGADETSAEEDEEAD
jgi:hypothetical protein